MDAKRVKVLVVDDLKENRFAMQVTLGPLDVDVLTAASGNEALSMMLKQEVAVVLLDVQMPEMDGFETARLMRHHKSTRHVPIIFVTAINKDEAHVFQGYESGAVDYLFKPVNPDILLSKVRVFVNLYLSRQENRMLLEEINKVRSIQSLGVLAGGIAHDFNNILAAIGGNLELVRMSSTIDEQASQRLESSLQAIQRASLLTQQLLTFSKGGAPLKSRTDLQQIIVDMSNFVFSNSSCKPVYLFPDVLPSVIIDSGQISQVFQNIFLNAKEAMPNGGEVCISLALIDEDRVDTALPVPGQYIQIQVTDSGEGISRENVEKVFDPYFTTKEEWNRKGQGLGLAVCRSIIVNHDGYITLKPREEGGTRVTIVFPVSDNNEGHETLQSKIQTHPVSSQQKEGRILVLDDDEMILDLCKGVLEEAGYSVQTASNGEEALTCYEKAQRIGRPIDVAILDLTIPGGEGGKEVAPRIRAIDSETKLVVASGYSDDSVISNYAAYGFTAAIAKPFQLHQLLNLVDKLLS